MWGDQGDAGRAADRFFLRLDVLLSVVGYGADFQGRLADAVKKAYDETVVEGSGKEFERCLLERLELRGLYEEATYYEGVKRVLEAIFAGCFETLSMDIRSVHALSVSLEEVKAWMLRNVGTEDIAEGLSIVEKRLGEK